VSAGSSNCAVRKRRWPKLFAFSLLVVSCVGAYQLALYASKAREAPVPLAAEEPRSYEIEGLVAATTDLDLGEVWEVKDFACALPIRNSTGSELRITDFSTSCGCVQVEPRSLTIPAGKTATVGLKLDLTHRSRADAGRAERPFVVEITPIQKTTGPGQQGWRLHGQVKSRVTLDMPSLPFGEEAVQGQATPARKVVATVHVPMQRLEAVVDPAVVTARVIPDAKEPNRFVLNIVPLPSLPTGPFTATVAVDVISPTGERLPGAVLPITGDVRPEVRAVPAQLFLTAKPVGQTADAVVVLQAPKDSDVMVDHVETDSTDLTVEPAAVPDVASGRAFRVSRRATQEGEQVDVVTFVLRRPGQEAVRLAMKVFSRGEVSGRTPATQNEAKQP
jgi:hypothetical protein